MDAECAPGTLGQNGRLQREVVPLQIGLAGVRIGHPLAGFEIEQRFGLPREIKLPCH